MVVKPQWSNFMMKSTLSIMILLCYSSVYAQDIYSTDTDPQTNHIIESLDSEQSNSPSPTTMQPIKTETQTTESVAESANSTTCVDKPIKIAGYTHYQGNCAQGLAHGYGVASGKKGKYEGFFHNGYFHGQGKLINYLDGKEYTGHFHQGKKEGEIKTLDTESGYLRLALFKNDVFQEWLDEATNMEEVEATLQTTSHTTHTSNIVPPNNNTYEQQYYEPPQAANNNIFIGKDTPYGKIIAMTETTFTTEKYLPNSGKIERKQFPLYYLK